MDVGARFEFYLFRAMVRLCPTGLAVPEADGSEFSDIFDRVVTYDEVARVLGPSVTAAPVVIPDAPSSLRKSMEHHYPLRMWPSFEFAILESADGLAWGHRFVRRAELAAPPIMSCVDLRRWLYLKDEITAALGLPRHHEGWWPWDRLTYDVPGFTVYCCYVFDLLQSVTFNDAV